MEINKQYLYLPYYLAIIKGPDSVMIRRRWFTWGYVPPVILFVIIMSVFAPPYVEGVIEQGSWVLLVILAPWFSYAFYYLLTKLFNSSYVFVNKEVIDVTHKPLPFSSHLRVPIENVARILLEHKRYKGRGRRKYVELSVVTKEGKKKKLLGHIDIEDQAIYIKKEIERFL